MVLTQLGYYENVSAFIAFPYHYGSHATEYPAGFLCVVGVFPYHYGSHATSICL